MDDKNIVEAISLDNLTWSQEEFTLSDFVDKFPLPQIVKVEEGYYGPDEDSCLGADQILFLHALKHTEKVQARDVRKRELYIPLNCSQKVEIRPSNIKEAFESVAELARIFTNKKIPQFVRVTQGYEDDNVCVNPGDKLKLLKVVSEQSQEYLEVEFQDGSGLTIQIPFTASARFQPLTDGRDYYIKEAVTSTIMPFFFQFIKPLNMSATGEASVFNSTLGVLRAEKTYQDSTIVCTTKEGETRTVVTCPKQLQITITAADGALVGDKEYMKVCRFFHDGVSLKKIENMECFNVFASRDTIREYQYDVPKTPTTPLEDEFKSNDEADYDGDSHEYTYIPDEQIKKWTFHRFNYEEFKNSFDSETDKDKLRNAEEGDNYEDRDEQPADQQKYATPVLHLEKSTPPPVKPKPVKVQGTHHEIKHHPEPTPKPRQTLPPTALTTVTPLPTTTPPTTVTPPLTTMAPATSPLPTATPQAPTQPTPPPTATTIPTATPNQEAQSKDKAAVASVPTSSKAASTTSNNLEEMTIGEVSQFLEKHRLAEFIETFEYNEVDGEMLVSMDVDMMEALEMNKFQQKKLSKLIQGWRPKC